MSVIHFVGGEKGGVGKSVFSRLMSQYFLDKHQPFRAFDADQSHHTLTRFYSDYATQINLDEFESTDQIMEATEDATQHILVDLPAQSERFLDRWIEENGVIDLCEEIDVPFYYWYVVDDGVDSSRLLERFLKKYAQGINCVVVKNKGCGSNFAAVDKVLAALPSESKGNVKEFTLPALHGETMRRIDELSFSFWGAENIKEGALPHLSMMERQRTKVWGKKAYAIFDAVYARRVDMA